jgi:hypothetical protein
MQKEPEKNRIPFTEQNPVSYSWKNDYEFEITRI